VAGLDYAAEDHVVLKSRFSAFYRTSLEEILEGMGVGTIVLAGVRTDFCIESTVRDAFFRDLRVVVAAEAVAGYFEELHRNSLRVMGTVFAEVVPLEEAARRLRLRTPPARRRNTESVSQEDGTCSSRNV
jgi:ureidoacrylate peracid hydrolase